MKQKKSGGTRRTWEEWYADARRYYEEHGDLLVSRGYVTGENYRLGRWIESKRAVYNGVSGGVLTGTQIAMLEEIGMVWKLENRYSWEQWMEKVRAYHAEHGNLAVPPDYVTDGFALGNWIREIRRKYRSGLLDKARIMELDDLGMIWTGCIRRSFEDWYRDAADYYHEHGDLLIPTSYLTKDGYRLGQWISAQREKYAGNNGRTYTDTEKIGMLTEIGMVWDIRAVWDRQWMDTYHCVCSYRRQYGKLPLYPRYLTAANGVKMPLWISMQRNLLTKQKVSADKRKLLSDIGIYPWGVNSVSS